MPRVESVVIAWFPIHSSLPTPDDFDPFAQIDPPSTAPYPRVRISGSITAIPYKDSERRAFNARAGGSSNFFRQIWSPSSSLLK